MHCQDGQSEEKARKCPACGGRLGLKLATSGGFIGCSNYPDCSYTRPLDLEALREEGEASAGKSPDSSCPHHAVAHMERPCGSEGSPDVD